MLTELDGNDFISFYIFANDCPFKWTLGPETQCPL